MVDFTFKGGTHKRLEVVGKFHAFFAVKKDDKCEEMALYTSLKNGIVKRSALDGEAYTSETPYVKIFSAIQGGFGQRRFYYSFFIEMNNTSNQEIIIRPFVPTVDPNFYRDTDFRFVTKGSFLTTREEIEKLYGSDSDTVRFWSKQPYVSKTEIASVISLRDLSTVGTLADKGNVRKLRF